MLLIACWPAAGQQVDSSRVAANPDTTLVQDSTSVPGSGFLPDSLGAVSRKAGFFEDMEGEIETFGAPRSRAELDLTALLASLPGVYNYGFGTPGWPGAPGPSGLDPSLVGLSLDGLPFEDLITGRPRYDLLPYGLIDNIRTDSRATDRVFGVRAVTGAFEPGVPLTDIRDL